MGLGALTGHERWGSVIAARGREAARSRYRAGFRPWPAVLSAKSTSISFKAQLDEPDSELRTPLQRDGDRIAHSKAFRRLKHKTQIFIAPEGDHYRTRLAHTDQRSIKTYAQPSRAARRALQMVIVERLGVAPIATLFDRARKRCCRAFVECRVPVQTLLERA
jgi:hypothetical protein